MGYINKLFKEHTEKNVNAIDNYKKIITFLKENEIQQSITIKIGESDFDFLDYFLRKKSNGLGNFGRYYVDIEGNKKTLIGSINQIKSSLKKNTFNYQVEVKELGFKSKDNWNLKTVYHRVLTALNPEELCNIPGVKAIDTLLNNLIRITNSLESNSQDILKSFIAENNQNWYAQNKVICKVLNSEIERDHKNLKDDIDYFSARNTFAWELFTHLDEDFSVSRQIIKYGAPGTGKTYLTKKECEAFFDRWSIANGYSGEFKDHYEVVQFHPSYTYEDFIEGIRPTSIDNRGIRLELKDGVFKAFCKKAAKWEFELYKNNLGLGPEGKPNSFEKIKVADLTDAGLNENEFFKKLVVGKGDDTLIKGLIPPYFFVIDEINRAELSRVFGELMYCLEYRGYPGKVKTQYSELAEGDTIYFEEQGAVQEAGKESDQTVEGKLAQVSGPIRKKNYFFIPHNVYIIGTMNTIDRSVESFDFALRRRFLWQHITPSIEVLSNFFNKADFPNIIDDFEKLNEAISENPLLGEDFQIGHSYLMKTNQYPDLTEKRYKEIIWEKHISPILEEYFRGLGENKKEIERLRLKFIPETKK